VSARAGPSIRTLLLGAHAFVLFLPLGLFAALRVYDVYLLRQTERQLIGESVMAGEVFRAAYLAAVGKTKDDHRPPPSRSGLRDSVRETTEYAPVEAVVDFGMEVLPREPASFPSAGTPDRWARAAGQQVQGVLQRAQTFNLSALRILDGKGCVVASTRGQDGQCLSALPEVQRALGGQYAAVLRERVSDEPAPPLGSMRRRGKVRVFTALPVWSDGKVIAVVRGSRTGLDALASLWANRRGLLWLALFASISLVGISLLFARAIARPIARLTRAAQAVAREEDASALVLVGRPPREVAELEAVLLAMVSRLAQRTRYVRDFASEVSHELKTPITAIRGAAELVEQGLMDMPVADKRRFLSNIIDDAERMERLVTRLLQLARAENPQRQAEEALDVEAVARALLSRHGAAVTLASTGPLPAVHMAQDAFETVLHNLVDNALRHGAGKPVRVTLGRKGERLSLQVNDQGKGLSAANQGRLFERFFTTERERGGTGLGLAIVKALAESRGGSAHATFDGEGTTFHVVL
jgi:signal transduction histidine kinase